MALLETIVAEKASVLTTEAGKKITGLSIDDIKEIAGKRIEVAEAKIEFVIEKLSDIKNMSPEQLFEQMEAILSENDSTNLSDADDGTEVKEGLSDEEKQRIKEETGWSDEIVDSIGSWEEYMIYKEAGLVEAEINGKKCLIRSDIDWNQKDSCGRTNKERVEQGYAPIGKDGKPIELHHIGQHADSPLAELTHTEHKENDGILHNKKIDSEIDRNSFSKERVQHWLSRINEGDV